MTYLYLLSSVLLSWFAQIVLKLWMANFWNTSWLLEKINFLIKNWYFWWWLFLYWFSMLLRLYVLSKFDLSYAYPFVAISYIVVLIWWYFLWEDITIWKIIWISLILIWITFIAKW